jgi:hypothetical protein
MTAVPETPVTASSSPSNTPPSFFQKNRIWFLVIGLFLLSNFSVYFYQRFQHNRLLKACHAELDKKAALGNSMTINRNQELASNLCRTLVWGIRGEMERGNKGEIELFINKLVQETGLELVVIQNAQDSIYLSTDKNYENHKVAYLQKALNQQEVLKSEIDETVVASPIMGTEARLGTCLIIYKAPLEVEEMLRQMHQDSLPGDKSAQKPK